MNRKAEKSNKTHPLYDIPRIGSLRELMELKYQSCSENIAFSYPDETGNKVSKTFGEVYHDSS